MVQSDLPQAAALEAKTFSMPWKEEDFAEMIAAPYAHFFVADEDGRIVGIIGLRDLSGEGEITNVAVRPAWRGQGIARLMLAKLLEEGRRAGGTAFTLEVRAGNAPAIALYEGLGFRYEARRPGFYTKPVEDALLYWLKD